MSIRNALRLLVVDDMSVSRALVTQALDEIGLKNYNWEKDGQSALAAVVRSPCHLVISDYEMPKMNGLQLLENLRLHKATQSIGFILLTGSADPALIDRGRRLGMNNFLKKPFTALQLKKCIEAVVGKL